MYKVVIALSSGELAYFELDTMGNLNEYPERKEMTAPVTCLALGPVPDGKLRSKFLVKKIDLVEIYSISLSLSLLLLLKTKAVGCEDNTVRLYSLDPASCLQSIGIQALQSSPESITLTFMSDTLESSTAAQSSQEILFMHIGLSNGILVRSHLDAVTGSLSDLRSRFIGARACSLSKIRLGAVAAGGSKVGVVDQDTFDAGSGIMATEGNAVLVLSSRPWIGFVWKGKSRLVPLS